MNKGDYNLILIIVFKNLTIEMWWLNFNHHDHFNDQDCLFQSFSFFFWLKLGCFMDEGEFNTP